MAVHAIDWTDNDLSIDHVLVEKLAQLVRPRIGVSLPAPAKLRIGSGRQRQRTFSLRWLRPANEPDPVAGM